jgi:integrase
LGNGSGKTRPAETLTPRSIEAMKPEADPYRVPDLRCPGLAIRIAPSGIKTWDVLFRIRGTAVVKRKALGAFPGVTLAQARDRMAALGRAAQAGRDLLLEEEEARAQTTSRITVEKLIDDYVKRGLAKLRSSHVIEVRLRRALHTLRHRAAADVTKRDIRDLLDAVSDRGRNAEADSQRQAIGALFSFGVRRDHIQTNPTIGLDKYHTLVPRDRVLPPDEVRVFWEWLANGAQFQPDYADVLRLQLCIGARVGEIAGIEVEDVDAGRWVWTLPASRSKNKKPRMTPIVGIARNIIQDRLAYTENGRLFSNSKGASLTSVNLATTLISRRKSAPIASFTSHDLRRTVATELIGMGIGLDLVADILGHEGGTATTKILTKHYARADMTERKRAALLAWDARLTGILEGQVQPVNVVQFADVMREAN